MFEKMRPGTLILNVHLDFTKGAQEAYVEERFGYAPFNCLRTAASVMIRKGILGVSEIEGGRAHVHCDEYALELIVKEVINHRQARRVQVAA